jgi:uncharacterized protein (TIGR01777 family)
METILVLLSVQGFLGAYDSIYHHEFKERLSLNRGAIRELQIHSLRSVLYSVVFLSFAWVQWQGLLALAFALILVFELVLTLWDFVVEDQTRVLPPTERITHTVLGINFGAILALLAPKLWGWYQLPTDLTLVSHGVFSWIMTLYGVGVIPFAVREFTGYRALRLCKDRGGKIKIAASCVVPSKNVLITGGTGFIGRYLSSKLLSEGYRVTILVRDFDRAGRLFNGVSRVTLINSIEELTSADSYDIIINLAGAPIADGYWSRAKKLQIVESRLQVTRQIISYIKNADNKPGLLISGSAIGYYGAREDEVITEESLGLDGFSHRLCAQWEGVAQEAEHFGVRVCLLRTGLVLGKTGGALAAMLIPFSYGLGGRLGGGQQWMSWIHIADVVGIIFKVIEDATITGPVNVTAPNPVRNRLSTKTLGRVLHRPTVFSVPSFVLRRLVGELADELLLTGQKVLPKKITAHGYQFLHPSLRSAIEDIVKS